MASYGTEGNNPSSSTISIRTEERFQSTQESEHEDQIRDTNVQRKEPFLRVLFEQSLKAFLVLYLAVGIVSAVVYVARQVVLSTEHSDPTWRGVGMVKAVFTLGTVAFVFWYKALLTKHDYLKPAAMENSTFFYTFIVITSAISAIFFVVVELRNIQYYHFCEVLPDVVVPLTQLLFVLVSVMAVYDLVFFTIRDRDPSVFYVVYKSAATAVFVNCVNSLLFDLASNEARSIQFYLSNKSRSRTDIFCLNYTDNKRYVKLLNGIEPFLEVFSVIYFTACVAILVRPLRQFEGVGYPEPRAQVLRIVNSALTEAEPLLSMSLGPGGLKKYNVGAIVVGLVLCLLGVVGVFVDIAGKTVDKESEYDYQITFLSLPLGVYVVAGGASIYLLRLLHRHFHPKVGRRRSIVDAIVIWASTLGQLVCCLKMVLNSAQFLDDGRGRCPDGRCRATYILCIILFLGSMVQSALQSMALDLLNSADLDAPVSAAAFTELSNPVVVLTAGNIGLFVASCYLLSTNSSFSSFQGNFNQILWDFLSTISDPLTLVFRGYAVMFLLRVLSRLRVPMNGG